MAYAIQPYCTHTKKYHRINSTKNECIDKFFTQEFKALKANNTKRVK